MIDGFHQEISAALARVFGGCSDRYRVVLANGEAGKTFPEIILFLGSLLLSHILQTTASFFTSS